MLMYDTRSIRYVALKSMSFELKIVFELIISTNLLHFMDCPQYRNRMRYKIFVRTIKFVRGKIKDIHTFKWNKRFAVFRKQKKSFEKQKFLANR